MNEKNRLREALLVAKFTEQQKEKKRKTLRYNKRFIFKIEEHIRTAFIKHAKSNNSTGAKILRNYIERLLGKSGKS